MVNAALLRGDHRIIGLRFDRLQAGDGRDRHHLDLQHEHHRAVLVDVGHLGAGNEAECRNHAGMGVAGFTIDREQGALDIVVHQRNEPFGLFLGVADKTRAGQYRICFHRVRICEGGHTTDESGGQHSEQASHRGLQPAGAGCVCRNNPSVAATRRAGGGSGCRQHTVRAQMKCGAA